MSGERNPVEALKAFASLDLHDWHGLPEHTQIDHARQVFDLDEEWNGSGKLGSARRQAYWYSAACDGFPESLRIWGSGNDVILLDAASPELPQALEDLLTVLGSPEVKMDSFLGTLPIKESEWVFPGKGITFYINPDNWKLLRIAVYKPIGLSEYKQFFRLDLKKTRLPLLRNRFVKESP